MPAKKGKEKRDRTDLRQKREKKKPRNQPGS